MKTCNKCGIDQPLSEFKPNKTYKLGRDHTCRTCRNAAKQLRYHARRDLPVPETKICSGCKRELPGTQFTRGHGADGRRSDCNQCKGLKSKYKRFNITAEDFLALMDLQGGGCGVCKKTIENLSTYHIDHDHECCPTQDRSCGNCVRGALCGDCNVLLVAGYDRLPEEMRTWPLLNTYLAGRPMTRIRLTVAV